MIGVKSMMKKYVLPMLLGLGLSMSVSAYNNSQLEAALERTLKKQEEVCLDGIYQVETINNRYFVQYTANSCGGNLTWSALAEMVYHSGTGKYSVIDLNVIEKYQNFAYIDSMEISDDGILSVVGLAYGDKDGQHRPRDKYLMKIRLFDKKLLSNQFIGRLPEDHYGY